MNNTITKEEKEKRVFEVLVGLLGLAIVPDSIRQNQPPVPDIECEIKGLGWRAYELAALDSEETRTRLSHMSKIKDSWKRALEMCSEVDRNSLCDDCRNAYITLDFENSARPKERTKAMKAIQRFLLSSPGFVGLITPGSIGNPMGYVKGHLYRDPVLDGPKFSSFSFGDWLGPQLEKIARKLTENYYKTNFPLELFAYSEHDDPDGHVDSRHEFEECVRKHLPNLKFIRVHLFYLAHKKYLYSIPLL